MDGEKIYKLHVFTSKNSYYIDEESEMDQEGSLIKFFKDGNLQLVINTEDFLWCERTQLVNINAQEIKS